jgi:hypothetical protein
LVNEFSADDVLATVILPVSEKGKSKRCSKCWRDSEKIRVKNMSLFQTLAGVQARGE